METYHDHPLAFLCGRPSTSSLRHRAENWRTKKHDAKGIDVAAIFDRTANNIDEVQGALSGVLDMVRSEADLASISRSCGMIKVDLYAAGQAFEVAQFMRERMLDPYGGSVCASLEMAWEELRRLRDCVETVETLAETVGTHASIEAVLVDALDLGEQPVATHEAPRAFM